MNKSTYTLMNIVNVFYIVCWPLYIITLLNIEKACMLRWLLLTYPITIWLIIIKCVGHGNSRQCKIIGTHIFLLL